MWWVAVAVGSAPLPDYREELVQRTWHRVDSLIEAACSGPLGATQCHPEPLEEAIQRARAFQEQVTPDARLEYLVGLAWLRLGEPVKGEAALRRALALDAARADAWHDLGELLISQGRFAEAREAFEHVARLVPDGSRSWLGPWRLAEVAAHVGDAQAFEAQMKIALSRGFSFRQIRGLPHWKGFAADPHIGPSVRKLVTVYGTPDILESLDVTP